MVLGTSVFLPLPKTFLCLGVCVASRLQGDPASAFEQGNVGKTGAATGIFLRWFPFRQAWTDRRPNLNCCSATL